MAIDTETLDAIRFQLLLAAALKGIKLEEIEADLED